MGKWGMWLLLFVDNAEQTVFNCNEGEEKKKNLEEN